MTTNAKTEAVLPRLERNLTEQIDAQRRLLSAIESHRAAMAGLDLVRMRSAMDDVNRLVGAVRDLIRERAQLFDEADVPAPQAGAKPGEIMAGAWRAVLTSAPEGVHDRIEALREEARSTAERVARANGVNRAVNERALAHFGSLLTAAAGSRAPTYARRGGGGVTVKAGANAALIDRVA